MAQDGWGYPPPQQQWTPHPGYGWPQPPPKRGMSVGAIVAIAVTAALGIPALLVAMLYVAGSVSREAVRDTIGEQAAPFGYVRVPASPYGASFMVSPPGGWEVSTRRQADVLLGYHRLEMVELRVERIAVNSVPERATTTQAALDRTIEELPATAGLTPVGVPRADMTGGYETLLQRLRTKAEPGRETWVAVFMAHGARWVVLYQGPANDSVELPGALSGVLGGWAW